MLCLYSGACVRNVSQNLTRIINPQKHGLAFSNRSLLRLFDAHLKATGRGVYMGILLSYEPLIWACRWVIIREIKRKNMSVWGDFYLLQVFVGHRIICVAKLH